jgi:hypothetical protein
MKQATLTRIDTSLQGTFGVLECEDFRIFTTELPWRNNERTKSCIPEGLYKVSWHKSPRFGFTYKLQKVPGRSEILLHSGNLAGSMDHRYNSHSHGCILPALKLGILGNQKAGLISKPAMNKLIKFFNKEDFSLEIKNAYIPSIIVE